MSVLLAIDLGTEGARVGAFNLEGECLTTAHEPYPTSFPRPGWAEQNPEDWWTATVRATRAALAEPRVRGAGEVAAISVATTASTVVVLDRDGIVLRPAILWMDSRASREADETGSHAADHPVLAYSGGADAVEWLVPKPRSTDGPDEVRVVLLGVG
jgi:sugar (pentulose or hexulose) kinase